MTSLFEHSNVTSLTSALNERIDEPGKPDSEFPGRAVSPFPLPSRLRKIFPRVGKSDISNGMNPNAMSLLRFVLVLSMGLCTFNLRADEPGKAGAAERDGAKPKAEADRDGNKKPAEGKKDPAAAAGKNSKEGKMFATYDKDGDGGVSADEMAGMKEGKQNSRAKREFRKAVDRADKDEDGQLNLEEFTWWLEVGRSNEREKNR